jgi:hypothetical protein
MESRTIATIRKTRELIQKSKMLAAQTKVLLDECEERASAKEREAARRSAHRTCPNLGVGDSR